MRKLMLLVMLAGCSASQDAAPTIDCAQEAGSVARIDGGGARLDGGGLAEVQRGIDAGAGVDACPDASPAAERTADAPEAIAKDAPKDAPAVDKGTVDASPEASRDLAPSVDGTALDSGAVDSHETEGGLDAEPCPPNSVLIEGNCMLCGTVGNFCCKGDTCKGATCKNGACVAS